MPSETPTSFSCPHCKKQFLRRENLSRHLKTHDIVKPHKCSVCKKEFTRSDLRQRHEATHVNGVYRPRRIAGPPTISAPAEDGPSVSNEDQFESHAMPTYQEDFVNTPRNGASSTQVSTAAFSHLNAGIHLQSATSLFPPSSSSGHVTDKSERLRIPQSRLEPHHYQAAFAEPSIRDDAALIWSGDSDISLVGDWFNDDFYAALQETDPRLGPESANLFYPSAPHQTFMDPPYSSTAYLPKDQEMTDSVQYSVPGSVSRVSSPPNEASGEDQVAFAWDPRANQILTAEAINIPDNHSLYRGHDSTFDISEEIYNKVKSFQQLSNFEESHKHRLTMPQLSIANLFIGLFFSHFEPQMPVIHRATLASMEQLPEPLIAIMIVIGAIYSGEKHTRRFAIVLLDIVRMSLQRALELDNSLMRKPEIIYASALICHTGLWCGNKRAFELAEALRGVVVTYCRRNQFAGPHSVGKGQAPGDDPPTLNQLWRTWISEELRKRLCWVVYSLDCQFPSILYLPPTISAAELAKIECPCDEEFWQATTARKWKRLLGPASVPPSKTFSSVVGPFLGPMGMGFRTTMQFRPGGHAWTRSTSNSDCSHPKNLNSWTRFLLLMTIHVAIFEYTQQLLMARQATHEGSDSEEDLADTYLRDRESPHGDSSHSFVTSQTSPTNRHHENIVKETMYIDEIFEALARRKTHLQESLVLFADTYLNSSPPENALFQTSQHFQHLAEVVHRLGLVLLEISVSDLQDSLGKSGGDKLKHAMSNISRWVNKKPDTALRVVLDAMRLINLVTPAVDPRLRDHRRQSPGPYELIAFFLSVVQVWAFVVVASTESKARLLQMMKATTDVKNGSFFPIMERALIDQDVEIESRQATSVQGQGALYGNITDKDNRSHTAVSKGVTSARAIFREAAEVLTKLGSWGASLDLALLLHQRAKS